MAANEKKYSFYKKVGYFLSKEIEGILPCKHCGGFPILIRENSTGEITSAFSCSCQENHSTPALKNFSLALEIWNSKNKLPFPNAREFNMLNYVGIVVNPRTFQRLSRWKKNNIIPDDSYKCISESENGLSIFINKEIPDDVVKLLNKSDLKNIFKAGIQTIPDSQEVIEK